MERPLLFTAVSVRLGYVGYESVPDGVVIKPKTKSGCDARRSDARY